jgi:hypothetical protein
MWFRFWLPQDRQICQLLVLNILRYRLSTHASGQDFGGLKMVVIFEVDACLPSAKPKANADAPSTSNSSSKSAPLPSSDSQPSVGPDDLADKLSRLKISSSSPSTSNAPSPNVPDIQVVKSDHVVPQSHLIEVTTLSEQRARTDCFVWKEAFPKLYLSSTNNHYLGIHDRGNFTRVEKRTLGTGELAIEEQRAQPSLQKLKRILKAIQNMVVDHGQSGRLSLVCQGGELKVYKRNSMETCLPESILERFES